MGITGCTTSNGAGYDTYRMMVDVKLKDRMELLWTNSPVERILLQEEIARLSTGGRDCMNTNAGTSNGVDEAES